MKKIITLLSAAMLLFFVLSGNRFLFLTSAQTITTSTTNSKIKLTSTPTPTKQAAPTTEVDKNIKLLKEKIATKVAELRKENKTVIIGYIATHDKESLIVKSNDNKTHKITVDETITELYSLSKKKPTKIKIANLKVGDYVVVSGIQIDDFMSANIIYVDKEYGVLAGKVTDIDSKEFSIQALATDKDQYTLDVESTTKQAIYTVNTNSIQKAGFSKIKVGDTIHFVVEKTNDKKTTIRAPAIRLLIIPQEYFTVEK